MEIKYGLGILAILDSNFYDFQGTKINFHNPLIVKDVLRNKIGYGLLYLEDNKILAKINLIDYSILDSDKYLSCSGVMSSDNSNHAMIDFVGKKRKVNDITIYSIYLTSRKPNDSRILPVEFLNETE